jgi:hypothetical protein
MEPPERRLPEELEAIAARLQAEKPQADPLQLDDIKRRVIARCATTPRRSTAMKSKIATVATLVTLLGGTGGAIALGSQGTGNGYGYGAAHSQYCRHKGKAYFCRRKPHHHHHRGHHGYGGYGHHGYGGYGNQGSGGYANYSSGGYGNQGSGGQGNQGSHGHANH